jgi:hypothetical protein
MDTRGVAGRHWSELDVSADTKRFEAAGVKGLLDSLNALFAQRHQSGDVTFYCTGDAGGCETAHELVLALRSDYLKALLRWADAAPGTRRAFSLASFPFTRPVLTALLEYLYTGACQLLTRARRSVEGGWEVLTQLNASLSTPQALCPSPALRMRWTCLRRLTTPPWMSAAIWLRTGCARRWVRVGQQRRPVPCWPCAPPGRDFTTTQA